MFSSNEIEAIPLAIERQFRELENRVMQDIIRRIKKCGEITRTADWQMHRLYELGKSKKEIQQYIRNALKLSDNELNKIYEMVIESGYARDERLYKASGKDFIKFADNRPLQQLIVGISEQTKAEFKNLTQSLGFAVRKTDGKLKFSPIADYYQNTFDGAVLDITSGAFDYNTVLNRVVRDMTNSGLRTVDYASGWSNRVDVAARRAVMTRVNQITAKINNDNAALLDTEYFEVSWHSGARPSHQVWQGRVFTREQLETVCGLGTVTGLCGANCYHTYYPFIMGISERTYTDEQLEHMNAKENETIEYNGKRYTKYEALQKQRRLETTMRAQRQRIKLLKEGGADEKDIITARGRYMVTSSEYTRFSNAMNLPQQRERVTVDGFGNIGDEKYTKTVANWVESGIMKSTKQETVVKDVHYVGKIDKEIYKCVTGDIVTDDVIVTQRQIEHIKMRHPNDYERFNQFFSEIVSKPDYIIESQKINTALILKEIEVEQEKFKTVLRLVTSDDNPQFKNSIITFMKIDDKEWNRMIRNKKILYKSE